MNVLAGDGMWIPREDGEGAGTKGEEDGSGRAALPGEGAMTLDGEGVMTGCREGGEARGKLATGDGEGRGCKERNTRCKISSFLYYSSLPNAIISCLFIVKMKNYQCNSIILRKMNSAASNMNISNDII